LSLSLHPSRVKSNRTQQPEQNRERRLLIRLCGGHPPPGHLVAAVSGGGDSVALLRLLCILAPECGWRIVVGHVDHRLRTESGNDAEFVVNLAGQLGLECRVLKPEIPTGGLSPEEAARMARHEALANLADELDATAIALGHNAEDQAETLLIRALSGTGPTGMAGIRPNQGRLWRPMLNIGRAELRSYLNELGQAWRQDASNRDPAFLRNRVRNEILPLAARLVNTKAVESLGRLAGLAAQDEDYWQDLCAKVMQKHCAFERGSIVLSNECKELHPALLNRTMRRAASELTGSGQNLLSLHLEQLMDLWQGAAGRMLALPLGLKAFREHNGLRLDAAPSPGGYLIRIDAPSELDLGEQIGRIKLDIHAKPDRFLARGPEAWLSLEEVVWPLTIRPPQKGDRFHALGAPGQKRLSRFFTDQKLSKWWRARCVVVEDQKGIIWVGPISVSERGRSRGKNGQWLRLRLIDTYHPSQYSETIGGD
jgi:tRNA(Ile)-lysidine synthase